MFAGCWNPELELPLSQSTLKRCEAALERLERAVGAPLGAKRVPSRAATAYHHAVRAQLGAKRNHDRLLMDLDWEKAWDRPDYQRAFIDYATSSARALRRQSACVSSSARAEELLRHADAWAEPLAKASARLAELERLSHEVRARQARERLGGLTTQDIVRLSERELESLYRELDPNWDAALSTPLTDAVRRLTLPYADGIGTTGDGRDETSEG
jgi:hypothetical protein